MRSVICCCISRIVSYKIVFTTVCKSSESYFQTEKYSKQNFKNDLRFEKLIRSKCRSYVYQKED